MSVPHTAASNLQVPTHLGEEEKLGRGLILQDIKAILKILVLIPKTKLVIKITKKENHIWLDVRMKETSDPTSGNGKKLGEIRSRQTSHEATLGAGIIIFLLALIGTP